MSIDGQDDDYTAWLRRVEDHLGYRHAVPPHMRYDMTTLAEKDRVLDYDIQRGLVDFDTLARDTYMHWIKG